MSSSRPTSYLDEVNKRYLLKKLQISSGELSHLSGTTIYHGTGAEHIRSVLSGPQNIGRGFGGAGLYATLQNDLELAQEYASLNKQPVILKGKFNPNKHTNLRIAKIEISRSGQSIDLSGKVVKFPASWAKDATLQAYMHKHFDAVIVELNKNTFAINPKNGRYLVIYEKGGKAIQWREYQTPLSKRIDTKANSVIAQASSPQGSGRGFKVSPPKTTTFGKFTSILSSTWHSPLVRTLKSPVTYTLKGYFAASEIYHRYKQGEDISVAFAGVGISMIVRLPLGWGNLALIPIRCIPDRYLEPKPNLHPIHYTLITIIADIKYLDTKIDEVPVTLLNYRAPLQGAFEMDEAERLDIEKGLPWLKTISSYFNMDRNSSTPKLIPAPLLPKKPASQAGNTSEAKPEKEDKADGRSALPDFNYSRPSSRSSLFNPGLNLDRRQANNVAAEDESDTNHEQHPPISAATSSTQKDSSYQHSDHEKKYKTTPTKSPATLPLEPEMPKFLSDLGIKEMEPTLTSSGLMLTAGFANGLKAYGIASLGEGAGFTIGFSAPLGGTIATGVALKAFIAGVFYAAPVAALGFVLFTIVNEKQNEINQHLAHDLKKSEADGKSLEKIDKNIHKNFTRYSNGELSLNEFVSTNKLQIDAIKKINRNFKQRANFALSNRNYDYYQAQLNFSNKAQFYAQQRKQGIKQEKAFASTIDKVKQDINKSTSELVERLKYLCSNTNRTYSEQVELTYLSQFFLDRISHLADPGDAEAISSLINSSYHNIIYIPKLTKPSLPGWKSFSKEHSSTDKTKEKETVLNDKISAVITARNNYQRSLKENNPTNELVTYNALKAAIKDLVEFAKTITIKTKGDEKKSMNQDPSFSSWIAIVKEAVNNSHQRFARGESGAILIISPAELREIILSAKKVIIENKVDPLSNYIKDVLFLAKLDPNFSSENKEFYQFLNLCEEYRQYRNNADALNSFSQTNHLREISEAYIRLITESENISAKDKAYYLSQAEEAISYSYNAHREYIRTPAVNAGLAILSNYTSRYSGPISRDVTHVASLGHEILPTLLPDILYLPAAAIKGHADLWLNNAIHNVRLELKYHCRYMGRYTFARDGSTLTRLQSIDSLLNDMSLVLRLLAMPMKWISSSHELHHKLALLTKYIGTTRTLVKTASYFKGNKDRESEEAFIDLAYASFFKSYEYLMNRHPTCQINTPPQPAPSSLSDYANQALKLLSQAHNELMNKLQSVIPDYTKKQWYQITKNVAPQVTKSCNQLLVKRKKTLDIMQILNYAIQAGFQYTPYLWNYFTDYYNEIIMIDKLDNLYLMLRELSEENPDESKIDLLVKDLEENDLATYEGLMYRNNDSHAVKSTKLALLEIKLRQYIKKGDIVKVYEQTDLIKEKDKITLRNSKFPVALAFHLIPLKFDYVLEKDHKYFIENIESIYSDWQLLYLHVNEANNKNASYTKTLVKLGDSIIDLHIQFIYAAYRQDDINACKRLLTIYKLNHHKIRPYYSKKLHDGQLIALSSAFRFIKDAPESLTYMQKIQTESFHQWFNLAIFLEESNGGFENYRDCILSCYSRIIYLLKDAKGAECQFKDDIGRYLESQGTYNTVSFGAIIQSVQNKLHLHIDHQLNLNRDFYEDTLSLIRLASNGKIAECSTWLNKHPTFMSGETIHAAMLNFLLFGPEDLVSFFVFENPWILLEKLPVMSLSGHALEPPILLSPYAAAATIDKNRQEMLVRWLKLDPKNTHDQAFIKQLQSSINPTDGEYKDTLETLASDFVKPSRCVIL